MRMRIKDRGEPCAATPTAPRHGEPQVVAGPAVERAAARGGTRQGVVAARIARPKGYGLLAIILLSICCPLLRSGPVAFSIPPGTAQSPDSRAESSQTEPPRLKVRQAVERELKGGEAHSYNVRIEAGQYMKAVVEQKGIDVVVSLFAPDAERVTEVDEYPQIGAESLFAVAKTSGDYRLEVRAPNKEANASRYEVKVEELRESTSTDRTQVAAEKVYEQGNRLRAQQTAESRRKAIQKYGEALPLWRAAGNSRKEAITLLEIGANHSFLGETKEALEYYGRALPLFRLVADRTLESITLNNIGAVYNKMGEMQKALDYFGQSLPLKRAMGDQRGEANVSHNMGLAYFQMGELQESLEKYLRALSLWKAIRDRRGEATTLGNIGVVYSNLGEEQKALETYQQALSLIRAMGNRLSEGTTLYNIGVEYLALGDLPSALDYFNQSLPVRRETGDRIGEAYTLKGIGSVYYKRGERQKALEYYNQALELARGTGDRLGEASILSSFGDTYASLRETEKALDYFTRALQLNRAMGSRKQEASILGKIALAERDRGRLDDARTQIEAALNIVESTRSKLVRQELRTSFFASARDYYDLYIDLLMRMHRSQPSAGYDAAALQASERARARSLLDILAESRIDIRQGVDPSLLERERSLQRQLSVKAERLTRLLAGKHTDEQEKAAREEVQALLSDYQEVEAQIRAKSPRYAALTQPKPLSAGAIQRELDEDTLMLEYALGEERSYLWAVTPTSIHSFELPKRAEIEDRARRVYDLLVTKADALYPDALASLSQVLLGPVAGLLERKRLLIVGEGVLQYVPFGALPEPTINRQPSTAVGSRTTNRYQPLIVGHEVISLPSASVVAVLRREMSIRGAAPKRLAVLADPVFAPDDPRVELKSRQPNRRGSGEGEKSRGISPAPDVERSAEDLNITSFDRLMSSRREAELITSLLTKGQTLKAVDFDASRTTATSHELGRYQIVHFATHSLLNNRHPELSGIVLSLVDEQGKRQDGFLRLHEIYNLKLGADLIVLSACQTALGKEIRGEGLVGLSRGFMYAGAPRVVASLWKVSDRATVELMRRFYGNMIEARMRPAAALRAAQVSMWKERQWAAPYYWAGFVIQGEWR